MAEFDSPQQPPPYSEAEGGNEGSYRGPSGFNFGFVKTPPGILMLVNVILLFLCWTIMAGWRGAVNINVEIYWSGRSGFYLTATLIPWLIFLVFFTLMALNIHQKIPKIINFSLTMMINCIVWAVLLFVASCLIANAASKGNFACNFYYCHHLGACAAFGFFAVVAMAAEAFLHFREWRSPAA